MHLHVLLACFALISRVIVGVALHPFLQVSIKHLDLDWPLASWGYALAPLAYTVISAMASFPYFWSCQDEKDLDCVAQHCGGCSVVCIGKNIANCIYSPISPCHVRAVRTLCTLCVHCANTPPECHAPNRLRMLNREAAVRNAHAGPKLGHTGETNC